MKIKIISDIRFFEGGIVEYNNSYIGKIFAITNDDFFPIKERFLMKLREKNFCLEDFDHLYINFTTDIPVEKIEISKISADITFDFYRYVNVGVSPSQFNGLNNTKKERKLVEITVGALLLYCTSDIDRNIVLSSAQEILANGKNTEIIYKTKKSAVNIAEIVLKVLSKFNYHITIRLYNKDMQLIKEIKYEKIIGREEFIFQFGTILLTKNEIKIIPRNSVIANSLGLKALVYSI